jgi:hypothetical protein
MEGTDIKQKGIAVKLDRERHLIFDLNAFCELEERYGGIDQAMDGISKGGMKDIRYMLYLGLLNDDETLDEKKVGKLITLDKIPEIVNAISAAIVISSPESKNQKN